MSRTHRTKTPPAVCLVLTSALATGPATAQLEAPTAASAAALPPAASSAELAPQRPGLSASQAALLSGPALRVTRQDIHIRIGDDGRTVQERRWSMSVLRAAGVGRARRTALPYLPETQTLEVLLAQVIKPDGRRIAATPPKDLPPPAPGQGLRVVDFPEAAPGDTVELAYRLTDKRPMFPGRFSLRETLPVQTVHDNFTVRIDAPATLHPHVEAIGMDKVADVQRAGRRLVEWRWRNPQAQRANASGQALAELEREPSFLVSTFQDWGDIADAYGRQALPRAAVTPAVKALAQKITAGHPTPRETVRVLHEWVVRHVNVEGVCLAPGRTLPRLPDEVIARRAGDCKDHATLLQALLAAKGIASTQALLNAGTVYTLPRVPVASVLDHVINYVPSLDLFIDATAKTAPLGMLPFLEAGKPVFLAHEPRDGMKTPAFPVGGNEQVMDTEVKIRPDGSASGQVKVRLKGLFAMHSRARLTELPPEMERDIVKRYMETAGFGGEGRLTRDDPQALSDRFSYAVTFEARKLLKLPGPGQWLIEPLFYSESPVADYLAPADKPAEDRPAPCASGRSEENYRFELPSDLRLEALPDDVDLQADGLHYQARYRLEGQVLTVQRIFDDRTPGPVCPVPVLEAAKAFATRAAVDAKRTLAYR